MLALPRNYGGVQWYFICPMTGAAFIGSLDAARRKLFRVTPSVGSRGRLCIAVYNRALSGAFPSEPSPTDLASNSGTAIAGTVASAARFLLKGLFSGDIGGFPPMSQKAGKVTLGQAGTDCGVGGMVEPP